MKAILLFALLAVPYLTAGNTTALFQPGSFSVGPFPTDSLTIASASQKTGRQLNLPLAADCVVSPTLSACADAFLLKQLDGFSVNPRIMVCFSDAINTHTLQSGIFIFPVDHFGPSVPINQIFYDPATNCAFAKPDRVLNQQSRYALAVFDSIQDADGKKLKPTKAFKDCLNTGQDAQQQQEGQHEQEGQQQNSGADTFCAALSEVAGETGLGDRLVTASVFTTMSATDWLEQARQFVDANQPPVVLPAGNPTAFALAGVKSLTWFPQDNTGKGTQLDLPLGALGGVESIAFGLYLSPNFINVSGPLAGTISVTPTNGPINPPVPIPGLVGFPPGYVPVSFHVFLPPASQMPPGGFPVVIYGHGLSDNQFGAPTLMASTLAQNGFATLAIEIPGHGFGPRSFMLVNNISPVATPGRGIQFSPTGPIGSSDGCVLPGRFGIRDCARQTAVDLFALVRTIQETGGLGLPLNPARLYYVGQSFGAIYGTLFHAVEPAVKVALLNSGGGTTVDISRLSPIARQLGTLYLAGHNPVLLNVPPAPPEAYFHDAFNDNYVFRNQVVTNNVPGAAPIQAAFEVADWLDMLGDPLAYAGHLKTSPLAGVPVKSTLFQFGVGDLEVPNPTESALIRAADAQSSSWLFRFDVAVQTHPELLGLSMPGVGFPVMPHRFLTNLLTSPAQSSIALAAQQQVAKFFAADGHSNPDPNPFLLPPYTGITLFQAPAVLPEGLNFLQLTP